jgi:ABC-type glycerol-3-phosphate transport system permease component
VRSRGDAIAIFIARRFMLKIPDALLEAARIDGAGELTMFQRTFVQGIASTGLK